LENFAFEAADDAFVVVEIGLSGFETNVEVVDHVIFPFEPFPVQDYDIFLRSDQSLLDVNGNFEVY
jgi:hypothetical protein